MSNPSKNISNLYSPGEVVIDVSMPAAIRDGGNMLNRDNGEQDSWLRSRTEPMRVSFTR